jgi:peptidyl-prolyl cis-trans isomerase D
MAEQFTNTVYEQSDSLQPVIDKLKLEKKTATVMRTPAPGLTGPLASKKFLDAVFANDAVRNKRNTDAVEVAANQLISARVTQHQPARTLALTEVKDRVRERVMDEQAAVLARKEGQAREAAMKTAGGAQPLPVSLSISRVNPQGLPKPVMDAVMGADASKLPAVFGVDVAAQGYVLVRLVQVMQREAPPNGEASLRAQYAQAWAAAEAEAYLAALKRRYKVEIKPAAELVADTASAPAR